MIIDCISPIVCKNGTIVPTQNIHVPESSMVLYDVLRLERGVALFYEDHAERFFQSFVLANVQKPFENDFFKDCITQFITHAQLEIGNIRCVYYVAENPLFLVYQVKHSYPTPSMYEHGVEVSLLHAMRDNPNIKQELGVRAFANKAIAERAVYDVLLVDETQCVTEGSRTNVFFIKEQVLYTAPASDVLCGITRKKVVELLNTLGISCVEQSVSVADLQLFDGAFITGTSPKILPISRVDKIVWNVNNELLQRIQNEYNALIGRYITERIK